MRGHRSGQKVALFLALRLKGNTPMASRINRFPDDFDPRFKIFHELTAKKVRDILLVSTPYEAWTMEGEKALRFSPKYPQLLPQRSTVDDILKNSQRFFYSPKLDAPYHRLDINENSTLEKREVTEAEKETLINLLADTYSPEEHRIRGGTAADGHKVITFSQVLKHNLFPLADILSEASAMGQEGMGCPVELEFSVTLCKKEECKSEFAFLQLRPMATRTELMEVSIGDEEIAPSVTHQALWEMQLRGIWSIFCM